MARNTSKKQSDTQDATDVVKDTAPVIPVQSDDETEVLMPGESPVVSNDKREDSDTMTDVIETTETTANDPAEDLIKEATAKVTAESPKAVEMLDLSTLPPQAMVMKIQLEGLKAMAELIQNETKAFVLATSGKDEKVKFEITNLTESSAPKDFALRESIANAKATIAELTKQIERDETALYESVEARLKEEGEALLTEDQITEKTRYINDLYTGYKSTYKALDGLMTSHRAHRSTDDGVGTINQYVNLLPKPFAKSGSGSTGGTGERRVLGPKAPHVSAAYYSTDKGATWMHIEQEVGPEGAKRTLSNPTYLAAAIAKDSKLSAADIKEGILNAWYTDNGMTAETIDQDAIKVESEFDYVYPASDSDEYKTVKVRLTKRLLKSAAE